MANSGPNLDAQSIPDVSLVVRDVVFPQECQELFLKADAPVVFRLGRDVFLHPVEVGIADGECGIPRLPGESMKIRKRLVDPAGRLPLIC